MIARMIRHALVLCSLAACASAGHGGTADAKSCALGTPDTCGACTTVCPGMDSMSTMRTCSDPTPMGTCNIECLGEYYDLDGDASNGCEAQDLPVQDLDLTAVVLMLPDVDNGTGSTPCDGATNPCTQTGQIYSDMRHHVNAPTMRPLGREDWYKVVAVGTGGPNQVAACLGITNYPADNQYQICIGNDGDFNPNTCMTATGGGASTCVSPPTAADSGTFYVKLSKLAGTNTANQYALYVRH